MVWCLLTRKILRNSSKTRLASVKNVLSVSAVLVLLGKVLNEAKIHKTVGILYLFTLIKHKPVKTDPILSDAWSIF